MTYKTKRSLAQLGKHRAKKLKVQHPDEAPAPATKRCRHGYPAPAADAPPSSAHCPVRYARAPDLYEIVNQYRPSSSCTTCTHMSCPSSTSQCLSCTQPTSTALLSARRWTQCTPEANTAQMSTQRQSVLYCVSGPPKSSVTYQPCEQRASGA